MNDIAERVFNPGVLFTMIAAGVAYGHLLWAVNLRPTVTLVVLGIAPGATFLLMVWAIRAAQGTPSVIWLYLLLDWLVFACTGVFVVLLARRFHVHRTRWP